MQRNATYDYARLIAAFGIVLFHAKAPGAAIGYAALPFFLMLLIMMALPAAQRDPPLPYARARIRRLMRPWLIWSGVYGGLKLAEVALTNATFASEFAPYMLVTGPAIHLWFLPFALVASLVIYPLARQAKTWPRLRVSMALVVLGLALHGAGQNAQLEAPLAQWVYVTPAVFLGLALALVSQQREAQLALTAGFIVTAWALGWTMGLMQLGLACAALIACGLIHLPRSRASDIAAASAMGVYLAHPLMIALLERATPLAKSSLLFALIAGGLAWGLALMMPYAQRWIPRRTV